MCMTRSEHSPTPPIENLATGDNHKDELLRQAHLLSKIAVIENPSVSSGSRTWQAVHSTVPPLDFPEDHQQSSAPTEQPATTGTQPPQPQPPSETQF